MSKDLWAALAVLRLAFQQISLFLIVAIATALAAYTGAALLGMADWPNIPLAVGDTFYPDAGYYILLGLTVFAFAMCFFIPTNRRIMALENSHRRFHIGMQDVAHAYALAHQEDRENAFKLKSEFDSIRARLQFLREHPDLSSLEPAVLEVAAQMSHVSEELAQIYSEDSITRARDFLAERQAEVEKFNSRLEEAKRQASEIRQLTGAIEMEESVAQSQLNRLQQELEELIPHWQIVEKDAETAISATDPVQETERGNVAHFKRRRHPAE